MTVFGLALMIMGGLVIYVVFGTPAVGAPGEPEAAGPITDREIIGGPGEPSHGLRPGPGRCVEEFVGANGIKGYRIVDCP